MNYQSSTKRLQLFAHGRVQGVGFRHHVLTSVNNDCPNVVGKVRNTRDGEVEVVAEGPEEELNRVIEIVRSGPPRSKVTDLDEQWSEPRGDLGNRFDVTF